jgi:hypothetical protein
MQSKNTNFYLKNCILEDTYSKLAGGAIYIRDENDNLTIENCVFKN